MTHNPKNPFCDVCSKAKMQRRRKIRASSKPVPDECRKVPSAFGEQVTGDHFIKNTPDDDDEDPDHPKDTVGVVLYDRGTKWLAVYPKGTKTAWHTWEAMQHFAGLDDKIKSFYCDNAPELVTCARGLSWRISTSTIGMPQTNGVAENCVRRTREGGGF